MLEVKALSRVGLSKTSFTVAAGECLAVCGPSGAGKSLLLRAIADLDPADGMVLWHGKERNEMPGPVWRSLVGYLPAEPGWWDETIGQHFLNWQNMLPILARLGIPKEAAMWPISRPSTGERLRLALVRALERQPKVLLLDEPTAALDAIAVEAVESLIADMRKESGMAVIWVSHDEAQSRRVSSQRLFMSAGMARLEKV